MKSDLAAVSRKIYSMDEEVSKKKAWCVELDKGILCFKLDFASPQGFIWGSKTKLWVFSHCLNLGKHSVLKNWVSFQ